MPAGRFPATSWLRLTLVVVVAGVAVLLSVVPAVAGVVVASDAFRTACARRPANWMRLSGEIVGGDVVVGALVVVSANSAGVPATLLHSATGHVQTVPTADSWHAGGAGNAPLVPQARAIVPFGVIARRHVATPVPQSTLRPSSAAPPPHKYCPAPPPVHRRH
jgi:hypothetical protein